MTPKIASSGNLSDSVEGVRDIHFRKGDVCACNLQQNLSHLSKFRYMKVPSVELGLIFLPDELSSNPTEIRLDTYRSGLKNFQKQLFFEGFLALCERHGGCVS